MPKPHAYGFLVLTMANGDRWYHDDVLEVATLVWKGRQSQAPHYEAYPSSIHAKTRDEALRRILALDGITVHPHRSVLLRMRGVA